MRFMLLAALAVGGCLDGPEVGPPLADRCDDADLSPGVDVAFDRDLREGVFGDAGLSCNGCHSPGGPTPVGFDLGGLDLSSYATLRAGGISGPEVVVPGQPCASLLYLKLTTAPPTGERMPLGGPLFATRDQLALVHDWIAEGARDN